jgi:hypothetical protein
MVGTVTHELRRRGIVSRCPYDGGNEIELVSITIPVPL